MEIDTSNICSHKLIELRAHLALPETKTYTQNSTFTSEKSFCYRELDKQSGRKDRNEI